MNRQAIEELLPHRGPMLLLDEVTLDNGEALGKYHVRGDEWFLQGHFPHNPVVPGVVLCEIMAQACCVLLGERGAQNATPYFTKLDKVKFRRPVKPGETLESRCRIVREKPPFYFAEGVGTVLGEVAVSGEFAFAVMNGRTDD